jgi:hypothetical protein
MFREAMVQANIVAGRVLLQTPFPHDRQSGRSRSGGDREQLVIGRARQGITVDYDHVLRDQQVTVSLNATRRLIVRRMPRDDSKITRVEYVQPEQEPIVLWVGTGSKKVRYEANSLWHLLLQEPAICRRHLLPLLAALPLEVDLDAAAAQTEAALLKMANNPNSVNRRQLAAWVGQLADNRFSIREAADRQLRDAGRDAVLFLQKLDVSQLDAEQQFRIQRILDSMADGESQDSPESIAGFLCGDPDLWLIFMTRDSEPTRRVAKQHLERFLGEPIAFDPATTQPVRRRQIEQVRAKLNAR